MVLVLELVRQLFTAQADPFFFFLFNFKYISIYFVSFLYDIFCFFSVQAPRASHFIRPLPVVAFEVVPLST